MCKVISILSDQGIPIREILTVTNFTGDSYAFKELGKKYDAAMGGSVTRWYSKQHFLALDDRARQIADFLYSIETAVQQVTVSMRKAVKNYQPIARICSVKGVIDAKAFLCAYEQLIMGFEALVQAQIAEAHAEQLQHLLQTLAGQNTKPEAFSLNVRNGLQAVCCAMRERLRPFILTLTPPTSLFKRHDTSAALTLKCKEQADFAFQAALTEQKWMQQLCEQYAQYIRVQVYGDGQEDIISTLPSAEEKHKALGRRIGSAVGTALASATAAAAKSAAGDVASSVKKYLRTHQPPENE